MKQNRFCQQSESNGTVILAHSGLFFLNISFHANIEMATYNS